MAQMPGFPGAPGVKVDKDEIYMMAQQEMEYRVALFNALTSNCFDKCVERKYKDADLNVGENSCIDRCVSKYWQVTGIVGNMLGAAKPGM